jgi:hypothetical protein
MKPSTYKRKCHMFFRPSEFFRHNHSFSRLSYPDFKTGETFSPAHIWQSLI